MYILDTKKELLIYLISSVLCVLINYIYSKYSHDVSSIYMTYMFVIPLIGGILQVFGNNKLYNNLLACSILTLTLTSFIKGIFDIAGTESVYLYITLVMGILLLIISICKIKKE